jgi:anti-sigma B factor antagonist
MTTALQSSAWVEVFEEPGTLILRLCGELDGASREVIEPAVMAAIPTAYKVVLDLGDLTFCDSGGISMFIAAHQKADAEGHTLIVGNVPPNIARVLAVSGVDQVLNLTE